MSRKRREELLALRCKLKKPEATKGNNEDSEDEEARGEVGEDGASDKKRPKFRSYQPTSDSLKEQVVGSAEPADITTSVHMQLGNRQLRTLENIDFSDLAPKKPDWDLKRAIEGKLRKLERRTEKAISKLVQERLRLEEGDCEQNKNN